MRIAVDGYDGTDKWTFSGVCLSADIFLWKINENTMSVSFERFGVSV